MKIKHKAQIVTVVEQPDMTLTIRVLTPDGDEFTFTDVVKIDAIDRQGERITLNREAGANAAKRVPPPEPPRSIFDVDAA